MSWVKTNPTDDGLLINAPGQIRANWEALELMTDAALQIDNDKIAANAGIVDTKLATISTAGKVLGSALNTLSGIPAGAGNIPAANLGNAILYSWLDTDGTLAANSDTRVCSQKAVKTFSMPLSYLDTSTSLGTSDSKVPSQNAVKTYVDGKVSSFGAWTSKSVDTSYLAATDGIVCAGGASIAAYGYTDSGNPPTTVRAATTPASGGYPGSLTMPVKKGEYWKVHCDSGTFSYIYWIPMGA